MTTIYANLYNALIKAGIDKDTAEKVSAEVAEAKELVKEQKNEIALLRNDMNTEFKITNERINSLSTMFKFMIGLNVAIFATVIGVLFTLVFMIINK